MKNTVKKKAEGLLRFIEKSPTAFHAVREFSEMLKDAGFLELSEGTQWKLLPGRGYFVTRNGSSLIAFRLPEEPAADACAPAGFQIMASHSDSPSFKIKENPEIRVENVYVKLNVERYGGMLFAPWFDRPLSAAGRIIVERDGRLYSRLVDVDRDLLLIPNVAIHMNRKVNEGFAYDPQKDLLPLYGMCGEGKPFLSAVAQAAGEKEEDLRGMDLFLYNRQKGTVWGPEDCFLSAPRLDDLECAYASVLGLIAAKPAGSIAVSCVFDNEEVGSTTKQGAASTFLKDTLRRITAGSRTNLIINDDPSIAAEVGADGVHVGQGDMPVAEVRRRYPSLRIVGLSTHNPDQARAAIGQKPDYIGVGPVFATPTKKIPDPTLGVETAAQMIASVPFPAVAIGGLNRETLPSVLAAGARNFAVVRAVCGAADPEAAIRAIQQLSHA